MEKAHPDVIKLFLQVMSDGSFADSSGNKVNCKNIILILTGNFGMNSKGTGALGFDDKATQSDIEKEQVRLIQYCKERYGAEFVNRVDDFIPFMPLNETSLLQIANLRMQDFIKRIITKNVKISFSDDVPKHIVSLLGTEHGMNANVINRLIEKKLEPCLADSLLEIMKNEGNYNITIGIKNSEFSVKHRKTNKKVENED